MPGETDAAVIFKPTPGSKRWQHIAREGSNAEAQQLTTEDNYCVILGSHRNSSLKVEKCGIQCAMVRMLSQKKSRLHYKGRGSCSDLCPHPLQVQNVQEFQLSATKFQRFWINFDHGAFSIGTGLPGSPSLFSWKDPSPTAGTRHIGLAAWDKFVAYRNIHMHTTACCSTEAQVSPNLREAQLSLIAETSTFAFFKHARLCVMSHSPRKINSSQGVMVMPWSAVTECICMQVHDRNAGHVASLEELCRQRVRADLSAESVCAGLHVAHLIDPTLDDLAAPLLTFLAEHLDSILDQQKNNFVALPLAIFVALLKNPSLVSFQYTTPKHIIHSVSSQ